MRRAGAGAKSGGRRVLPGVGSVAAGAMLLCLSACGGSYRVTVDNQTDRVLYTGILERSRGGAKILATSTVEAGQTGELGASPEGKGAALPGDGMVLMVGQTPSPRDRALYRTLERGHNHVVVKKAGTREDAPIYIERVDE